MAARLRQWHAPRANRWERLALEAGTLVLDWLEADGAHVEVLAAPTSRWIAPGRRWRVRQMLAEASFTLEIWADESSAAHAPQPLRAALLDELEAVPIPDRAALEALLRVLEPGERCLLHGEFDFGAELRRHMAAAGGRLCWHPLAAAGGQLIALVARGVQPIGLAEYLGRDHALIEAALAGALRGEAERMLWLRASLARHLKIEEEILFPAWLAAGGNPGWVRGLLNEHRHLRADLERLDDPAAQRRFLLLLDGHDEKEEQSVYPDIVGRLGRELAELARRVIELGSSAQPGSAPLGEA